MTHKSASACLICACDVVRIREERERESKGESKGESNCWGLQTRSIINLSLINLPLINLPLITLQITPSIPPLF